MIDPRNIKMVTKGTHRFLQYNTVADKNHQGKISDCHFPPDLLIMENKEDLDRCPVYLRENDVLAPRKSTRGPALLKTVGNRSYCNMLYASSVVGEQTVRKYVSPVTRLVSQRGPTNLEGGL